MLVGWDGVVDVDKGLGVFQLKALSRFIEHPARWLVDRNAGGWGRFFAVAPIHHVDRI